jgi:hypothetical protein
VNSGKHARRATSFEKFVGTEAKSFDFDTSGVSFQNPVLDLEDDGQPAAATSEDALSPKGFDVE